MSICSKCGCTKFHKNDNGTPCCNNCGSTEIVPNESRDYY